MRRSFSAEVLVSSATNSPSKQRQACTVDGEESVDSPDSDQRGISLSPQHDHNPSLSLRFSAFNSRSRSKSESASQTGQQKRKVSLQEVTTAVVPYLPAATVAIHVGIYFVMKAFSS